jgi:RHH-type rel operon transcriptional repressor/antitoxin RelB
VIDAIDTQSLREFDDSEDLLVAKQRLEDWRKGESETISLADLMKKYGLND